MILKIQPNNEYYLRFIPFELDDTNQPWVNDFMHMITIQGKVSMFRCHSNNCIMCKQAQRWYDEENDNNMNAAMRLYRKPRISFIVQVIKDNNVPENAGKIMITCTGKKLHSLIMNGTVLSYTNGDIEELRKERSYASIENIPEIDEKIAAIETWNQNLKSYGDEFADTMRGEKVLHLVTSESNGYTIYDETSSYIDYELDEITDEMCDEATKLIANRFNDYTVLRDNSEMEKYLDMYKTVYEFQL
jgi:hypothetical protein